MNKCHLYYLKHKIQKFMAQFANMICNPPRKFRNASPL